MNCPQCEELVDDGAAFCGNCGFDVRQLNGPIHSATLPANTEQVLRPAIPSEAVARPMHSLPAYAVVSPIQARAESKAMVALIVSVLAMPAAIIPFLGTLLAVVGLVLGTTSRAMPRRLMSNLAVGFSCLALLLSAAAFAYNSEQRNKLQAAETPESYQVGSSSRLNDVDLVPIIGSLLETECYRVNLVELENIENSSGSCNARAFNADTLSASSNIFTVDAARQPEVTVVNFLAVARELVGGYVQRSLPDFTLDSQKQATFAGSPAYIVDAHKANGTTIQIALVLRQTPSRPDSENIFVLVHGVDGSTADLSFVADKWEWR